MIYFKPFVTRFTDIIVSRHNSINAVPFGDVASLKSPELLTLAKRGQNGLNPSFMGTAQWVLVECFDRKPLSIPLMNELGW